MIFLKHGDNCEECELGCQNPRPEGCTHSCPSVKCHPGPCPPCNQMLRMRCHCQISVQHVRCEDWVNAPGTRESLQSCGGECPKQVNSSTQDSHTCNHVVMLIVSCSLNRLSTFVAEFTLVMIKDTFLPVYNVCLSSLLLIYNRQIGILFCLQSLAV